MQITRHRHDLEDHEHVGPYVHQSAPADDRSEDLIDAGTHMCEYGCGRTAAVCRELMCRGRTASEVCASCGHRTEVGA